MKKVKTTEPATPDKSLVDMPLTEEQAEQTKAGGLTKVGPGHLILPTTNS